MAADFNKPTVSSTYTLVPGMVRDNDAACATMHETDASSNKPTGTKRISATGEIQRWNGSAWVTISGYGADFMLGGGFLGHK